MALLLASSVGTARCGWYVGRGMKGVVKEGEEDVLSLYVETMAALTMDWRAMSSVRVVYVSGLGKSLGQSSARWLT